ncbi:unnamed protein product [Lactuca saligna]|uniref:Uncharacterized protein n=1 Tax=Lactuca saligna TaxID=75948 RepID=A0AA35ZI91_LACSI|nr:unnamed protein product [Lactuca saligna]
MVISSNVYYHPSFVNLSGYTLDLFLIPFGFMLGWYLAIAFSDSTVKIWNVDGFTLEKTLVGHQRWVWDWVFSMVLISLQGFDLASLSGNFFRFCKRDLTNFQIKQCRNSCVLVAKDSFCEIRKCDVSFLAGFSGSKAPIPAHVLYVGTLDACMTLACVLWWCAYPERPNARRGPMPGGAQSLYGML